MPKIEYITRKFSAASLDKIEIAEAICQEYAQMGYALTLRQLYYQFVARGHIANKQTEYDNLGALINDARLAGMIDWNHLEDRTRNLRSLSHWADPAAIMDSAAASYRVDRWADQPNYVEVWVEKDALVGVLENVCSTNDVPYFSCRGYTSQSEIWRAAMRLLRQARNADGELRDITIIHLGDHDPSGIDMTRDIGDRLYQFMDYHDTFASARVKRIALNYDQVEQYDPPPNPAKLSDSRAAKYIDRHGYESWELDALSPPVMEALIQEAIDEVKDLELWEAAEEREAEGRQAIVDAAERFRDEQAS